MLLISNIILISCQTGYHEVVGMMQGIQPGFKADGTTLYKGGKGDSTIVITLQREDVFGYYNLHLYYPLRKCHKVSDNIEANPIRRIGQDEIVVTIDGTELQTIVFDYHNCQLYNAHFGIRDSGEYSISVIRLVGEGDLSLATAKTYKPELFFTKTLHLEGSEKSIAKQDKCDYKWRIVGNDNNEENSIPSQCKDSMKYIFWASQCENVTKTDSVFGSDRGIGLRLTNGEKIKINLIGDESIKYIGEQVLNRTCSGLKKSNLCNSFIVDFTSINSLELGNIGQKNINGYDLVILNLPEGNMSPQEYHSSIMSIARSMMSTGTPNKHFIWMETLALPIMADSNNNTRPSRAKLFNHIALSVMKRFGFNVITMHAPTLTLSTKVCNCMDR